MADVIVGSYGTVSGLQVSPTISQYRGLPYGSIPARFKKAIMVEKLASGKHDGTKYGPICPQVNTSARLDQTLIPHPFEESSYVFPMDEFNCLVVNITKPSNVKAGDKLPVFCWIHGGAFILGSPNAPYYSGVDLVQRSIDIGQPIIYVAIAYRLHLLGGLFSCRQLIEESGGGNLAFFDQRLALQWIHKHIPFFGGDCCNVTLAGESAGSMSVHAHIIAGKKDLFKRAILQSGSFAGQRGPRPWEDNQDLVETMLEQTGSESWDALKKVDPKVLVKKFARGMQTHYYGAYDDSAFEGGFFHGVTKASTGGWISHPDAPSFCKEILVSDCDNEAIVLTMKTKIKPNSAAENAVSDLEGPWKDYYDFKSDKFINELLTDLIFAGAIDKLINSYKGNVYVCRFDYPDPYPNTPLKGSAHHAIDLCYMFNLAQSISEKDKKISHRLADGWITFTNGREPWAESKEGELVVDKEGEITLKRRKDITTRRFDAYHLTDKYPDEALSLLMGLMMAALMPGPKI